MSTAVKHLIAQITQAEVALFACAARLEAHSDSEALHDLRIHVRRLRSILRPLRGLPAVAGLESAAKALGAVSTPLRDLEVLAGYLQEQGLATPANRRTALVEKSYSQLAAGPELAALFKRLDAFPEALRAAHRQGALGKLDKHIAKRLAKQYQHLTEALSDPQHDRHRLRLLIKRVRYGADAYPQFVQMPKRMMQRLKAAQTALGDWHDHVQWLNQAQQHADLQPCVATWQSALERAAQRSELVLAKLQIEKS